MKNMTKVLSIALLSIGLLLGTSTPARALSVAYEWSAPMVSTDWDYFPIIPQFNSSLGTLNEVKITETMDSQFYVFSQNTDPSNPVSFTKDKLQIQLYDSLTGLFAAPVIDTEAGYSGHKITLNPGDTVDFGGYVTTNSVPYDYVGIGNTAQFVGNGVLSLEAYTFTQNDKSTSGGGELTTTQNTQANYDIKVEYDYAPAAVPEPSAGVLFGVGGLICWGWRRKVACKRANGV